MSRSAEERAQKSENAEKVVKQQAQAATNKLRVNEARIYAIKKDLEAREACVRNEFDSLSANVPSFCQIALILNRMLFSARSISESHANTRNTLTFVQKPA